MQRLTRFNGRKMTEFEQQMRDEQRCICCGTKVKVMPRYEKIDGKQKKVGESWPFECDSCRKTRKQHSSPTDEWSYGSARASMKHEFARRIGTSLKDGD